MVKSIDKGARSRRSKATLQMARKTFTSSAVLTPAVAAIVPQTIPPRAIAPCETMITVAFMRPLAHTGIAR